MRPSLLLALCCAVLALLSVGSAVQAQELSAPTPRADLEQRAEEMGLVEMESLAAADAAEEAADAAEAAADERTAALDAAMLAEDEATAAPAAAAFSMDESADKDRVLVEASSQDGVSSPFTDKLKAKAAKAKAAAKAAGAKAASKIKAGAAAVKSRMQATMEQIKAALMGTPKPPAAVPVAAAVAAVAAAQPVAAAAIKETKIPKFVASRAATARDMRLQRQAALAKAKLAREAADAAEYAAAVKLSWQSKQFERPMYSAPIQPHPSSNRASRNGDRNFNTLFPANTPLSDGKAPSQDSDFQHAGQGDLYVGHTGMIQHSEAVSAEQRPRGAQAPEPCSEQCEGTGLWRTAPCQDCIVRGMTNGWIVKSIQEQQKGYAYVHYARNQCVKYANEQHLRSDTVKGAPFAACFFQKMHETCNL